MIPAINIFRAVPEILLLTGGIGMLIYIVDKDRKPLNIILCLFNPSSISEMLDKDVDYHTHLITAIVSFLLILTVIISIKEAIKNEEFLSRNQNNERCGICHIQIQRTHERSIR